MTTLYIITRFITCPGAFLRCFLEQVVCRIHKSAVEDNRCLRRDETCSHVEHELIETPGGAFAICFVPMLIQFILAFFVSLTAAVNLLYIGVFSFPLSIIDIVCLWFGFSLLVNCFPTIEDAINMIDRLYRSKANIFMKIVFAPGAAISFVGAYIERYCVTFLTSVVLIGVMAYI